MKKGTLKIIVGSILLLVQVLAVVGSLLSGFTFQLSFSSIGVLVYDLLVLLGYFSVGIIGLYLLISGICNNAKEKPDYKWVILIVSVLMVFTCLGFCSSNKSLYLGAITEALGIKRSLFSINDTCRYVTSALINLFFGALVAKFGVRKMVAFGFASLIGSVLIYAYATNIFVFYLGGCLLGAGLAFTTTAMATILVKRWFSGNTGTVLGVVLAANGLGGATAAQIVTPIIGKHAFGYRDAYTLVAIILAVVGVIAVLFLREKPKDFQGELIVKNKKKARGGGWVGIDFSEAKKVSYFIPACIGIFLTGMVLSGVNGIGGANLRDAGLPDQYVSNVLSIHSLVLLVSKMLAGILYDKKGLRTMLTLCNVVGAVAMVTLAFVDNSPLGLVLAMIWGVTSSLSLPMETIGVSLVTSDLYGNKAFDQMLGIMLALNHLGYALGSIVVNVIYDLSGGTYFYAVLLFAAILLAVTFMYQFIISSAHKQRQAIEAAAQQQ